ncbi:MAG: septum formation initiator family protein [Paracoccaceae bacterium]
MRLPLPAPGTVALCVASLLATGYFADAATRGEHGSTQRAAVELRVAALTEEAASVEAEIAAMENLVRRLGDGYLDLDLLDERARDVLGHARADEIVLP